ncbi:MAG: hypothetical protein IPP66_03160 [Anaerolineales bacterium]|nr:hypothetical protein [Anaerolineales bacterium]
MANEIVQVVTDHYQKTFELTYETWKERNRLFVYLVLTTSVGLLFLLRVPEFDKLLVEAIASILKIGDSARVTQLYTNFPFDVLLSAVLVIIFYLMQKLYATNLSVFRYYQYLGAVEDEIRKSLSLTDDSVAFTREGKFYWGGRTVAQNISKWLYVLVLLITLLPFSVLKIAGDIGSKSNILIVVDIAVSLMTFIFLFEYTRSALRLDTQKAPLEDPQAGNDTKTGQVAISDGKKTGRKK